MKKYLVLLLAFLCLLAPVTGAISIHTFQVTIGSGVTAISTNANAGARQLIFQNNAAHVMRVGDSNTTSSRGALLNAASGGNGGGSLSVGPYYPNSLNLAEWYVAGTQNDVLDVLYLD